MADHFPSIAQLRLTAPTVSRRRQGAPNNGHFFLKGPVPLYCLQRAAKLPGRSLAVAVILWFLAGLNREATVRVTSQWRESFGLDRHALYRALRWLEEDGLITVNRRLGSCPVVTLVGWKPALRGADNGKDAGRSGVWHRGE